MDMDKYIGRLLDNRYEILEVIGTGGMAVVYKARCHRLNRLVAIKILRAEYTRDEEFRRRFHAESQAVAMLSHPNIVSVYDVSATDEADYIVMELIDGITLKQYMEKKGVLNWKETLHFAIQIAKALEHAHSRGIIHRDIKPHNVMVLKNGAVKVTDFGIAHMMSDSNTLTKEALGSVHYISPEQARGGRVDNRSDLYSLGVVMYEMSTGNPPYDGETPVAVAIQHINGTATLPSMLNVNLPGGLEQIIVRAMSHNPANRYPSASAMLTDMDEFRKNPAILFDYNNPITDIDAATRMKPVRMEGAKPVAVPATPASRPPQKAAPANRSAAPQRRPSQTGKKPAHRREVIVEEQEERSKVATVAIVACTVVAFVALLVLCFAFFGGQIFNSGDEWTEAPDLVGAVYDENKDYGDVRVVLSELKYSNQYEKNTIMEQYPKAHQGMAKGDTIRVVVSLGPEPAEKVMEDLSNVPQQQAESFLNDLNINLQILPKMESSSTVARGCVTRTEPTKGVPLEEGQTVYLWISTGPIKQTAKVPNVVGYSKEMANTLMTGSGFNNVTFEPVDSEEEKDVIVEQNITGIEVDINTPIVLKYSKGPQTGPTVPTLPPIEPDTYVEKVVVVNLPSELEEDGILFIYRDGILVEQREVYAGTMSAELKLRGENVMTFTAMIDHDETTQWTFEVNFGSQSVVQ